MKTFEVESTSSRTYTLLENGNTLGQLTYPNWYSFNAEISIPGGSSFQFKPKGFWESKIQLFKGDEILLDFKMGWKGIIINTHLRSIETSLLLKQKGILGNKYILLNTDGQEILAVSSQFKWRNFSYDFNFEVADDSFSNNELAILLLTIVHCINYSISTTTAATVAAS